MNCCVEGTDHILSNTKRVVCPIIIPEKIPRPPNAFMLYANEHRKTMAHLFPADSNKEISRRLGQTWKDLGMQDKNKYFQKAKDIDIEHKRKYPGYVYNPKDARMRKAIRTSLRDRSIGASPMLPKPSIRRANMLNAAEFYQNLILPNQHNPLQTQSPMWNGLCELSNIMKDQGLFSVRNYDSPYVAETPLNHQVTAVTSVDTSAITSLPLVSKIENFEEPTKTYDVEAGPLEPDLISNNNEEERSQYEKEKAHLDVAENYIKILKQEKMEESRYLPISATKFVKNPELFTNNAEYHKEYIIKYFNHIPDYETFNVTTEDGLSFPYVTIPNLIVRQNLVSTLEH